MATTDHDPFGPLDRLADQAGDQPVEDAGVHARAVQLVQSVDPFVLSPSRKQRLLMSVGHGSMPRPRLGLRPVLVGALLLGSGAAASAALTTWPASFLQACKTLVARRAEPARVARAEVARSGVAAPARPPQEPIRAAALPEPEMVRRAPVEVRARRSTPKLPADDPSLLITAARALRVDRDPKLARALATRYLDQHPRGALADEALAICIEAAVDHHDGDAAALSARYLAQFPHGSFRALAERTLAASDRP